MASIQALSITTPPAETPLETLSPRAAASSEALIMNRGPGNKLEPTEAEDIKKTVASYEDLVKQLKTSHKSNLTDKKNITGDALTVADEARLLFYPNDDVSIISIKRPSRTFDIASATTPRTPRSPQQQVDLMFRELYQELTCDWRVLKRNYERYGGKTPPPTSGPKANAPGWPENQSIKFPTANVPLSENLIKDSKHFNFNEAATKDKLARNQNRIDIFDGYSVVRPDNLPSDTRVLGRPIAPKNPLRVLVTCKQIKFALGNIEPYFLSMALFDVAKGKKLSETLYFDVNEESAGGAPNPDKVCSRSAIFSISDIDNQLPTTSNSQPPSSPSTTQANQFDTIYLVVRMEKLLSPVEGDQVTEPYIKQHIKPKEKEKLQKEIQTSTKYLWKYQQPFAWSYVPLFNADGSLHPGPGTSLTFTRIKSSTHTDRVVCETIMKNVQKNKGSKKPGSIKKGIPGEFLFDFKILQVNEEVPNRIDPSLRIVKPSSLHNSSADVLSLIENPSTPRPTDPQPQLDTANVVRELREFPRSQVMAPHSEVIHDLYIYPESLNFSKHKDSKVKNVLITVSIKEKHKEASLKAVYGKGATVQQSFNCTVHYNKKSCVYYDEIKIRLPTTIKDEQIIFNFYNIQCPVKHPDQPIEKDAGVAVLPLYSDQNRILNDQTLSLPVVYEQKGLDNKKPLFTLSTRLVSTLCTQEERLRQLFELYQLGVEESFLSVLLKELSNIPEPVIVQFFPPLIRIFITLITKENTAQKAFTALLYILGVISRVSGRKKRNELLENYLNFQFHTGDIKNVHQHIISIWLKFIQNKNENLNELASFSWFFFEMTTKALALHLQADKKLDDVDSREDRVPESFKNDVFQLVKWAAESIEQRVFGVDLTPTFNQYLAYFILDLFGLIDRGYVQSLISQYMTIITEGQNAEKLPVISDKFNFLRIVADYEHFIPLNLPISLSISHVNIIPFQFWKAHFLIGTILHEVAISLNSAEIEIRKAGISMLRDLLWKHDRDERYQKRAIKERIAGLYFPYLLTVLDKVPQIRDTYEPDEKRDIMICFLFVIKNCDRTAFLRKWWSIDTTKNLLRFLECLSITLDCFEEEAMSLETSYCILDIIEDFIDDKDSDLKQNNSPLMDGVFAALIKIMKKSLSIEFTTCLFSTVCRFIHRFKHMLFTSRNTSYCGDLCYETLRYANSENGNSRAVAASILYLMMKTNLIETSNFSRMRLQLTIAMSKYCGEKQAKDYTRMRSTLDQIVEMTKKDSQESKELIQHVEDIRSRLFKLIDDSLKIAIFDYDPEMTADLYYQVSTFYFDSPDLRVAWLENLSSYQKDRNNWEEAAQCKIYIAALIAEFLTYTNGVKEGIPSDKSNFLVVSPSISNELGLPPVDKKKAEEEGMYNSKTFSEDGFIAQLSTAIRYLKRSSSFELCIDVYNYLVELYETRRDYTQLASCFRDLKTICDTLCTIESAPPNLGRALPSYYWIMFYGPSWGEFENKSFIYKDVRGTTHLADMIERFMKQFSAKYKIENLRILNPKFMSTDKLTPGLCYFHIEMVTEYWEEAELLERTSLWDKKFNMRRFLHEYEFAKSGKPTAMDLLDQYRQKTILTVSKVFPYINTRLEIVEKKNITITPLETAIETFINRTNTIKADLKSKPVDVPVLRAHLQEYVSPASKSKWGTLAIITAFLKNDTSNNSDVTEEGKDRLKKALSELVAIIGVAIKLSKQFIGEEEQETQLKLEEEFNGLKASCNEFTKQQPQTPKAPQGSSSAKANQSP